MTALNYAINKKNIEVCRLLLKQEGCPIDGSDKIVPPLHTAILKGSKKMCELL